MILTCAPLLWFCSSSRNQVLIAAVGCGRALTTSLSLDWPYVEAVAALAEAQRIVGVPARAVGRARSVLDNLWSVVDVLELDETIMTVDAQLALAHGLRGYDATHGAAAVVANDADLVAASGDQRHLAAWRLEGVTVRDTSM